MKKMALWLAFAALTGGALRAQDITGTWQGTLKAGRDLRTVLKISKDDERLKATMYSIDQGAGGMNVTSIALQGSSLKFSILSVNGNFEGKLSADGSSIVGSWTQGAGTIPLVFARATKETAWAMPEPPARLPPMAANADPAFEVATIKPSSPDARGRGFRVNGRHFTTLNTSLSLMIQWAYGIQAKQIVGGPAWLDTDKYDISAEPDGEGQPNAEQWKIMLEKLLADRFKLTLHHDTKELPVYALVVAKGGAKVTKSEGNPDGLPSLMFRGGPGGIVLPAKNSTMADFASVIQRTYVDRPVVDQTGLAGRYDFDLNFTPDPGMSASMGGPPPPPPADNAPPELFTALQQQAGLKLEPTKAPVAVIVIDRAEKPSEN